MTAFEPNEHAPASDAIRVLIVDDHALFRRGLIQVLLFEEGIEVVGEGEDGEDAIKKYEKGQVVKAKVLDIDVEKERVSLGIKQLDNDPIEKAGAGGGALRKNQVVTGTVTEVNDGGIEVELADGVKAFIRRADLSRDRNDQRPERFGKGDKVDALVTSVDKASRKVGLSIKAREISEEKEAVAQFGSSDSGASLGDILGAALKKKTPAKKKGGEEEE